MKIEDLLREISFELVSKEEKIKTPRICSGEYVLISTGHDTPPHLFISDGKVSQTDISKVLENEPYLQLSNTIANKYSNDSNKSSVGCYQLIHEELCRLLIDEATSRGHLQEYLDVFGRTNSQIDKEDTIISLGHLLFFGIHPDKKPNVCAKFGKYLAIIDFCTHTFQTASSKPRRDYLVFKPGSIEQILIGKDQIINELSINQPKLKINYTQLNYYK